MILIDIEGLKAIQTHLAMRLVEQSIPWVWCMIALASCCVPTSFELVYVIRASVFVFLSWISIVYKLKFCVKAYLIALEAGKLSLQML